MCNFLFSFFIYIATRNPLGVYPLPVYVPPYVYSFICVLNHLLDAAHSLDKMSSVWARPAHSINCRVNGIEACLLDKLSIEWAGPYTRYFIEWMAVSRVSRPGPYARHFVEWMGHRPVHSTVYRVNGIQAHRYYTVRGWLEERLVWHLRLCAQGPHSEGLHSSLPRDVY